MPYFWKGWKGEGIGGFAMYEYVRVIDINQIRTTAAFPM